MSTPAQKRSRPGRPPTRRRQDLVALQVVNMPLPLKRWLAAGAAATRTNMNDIAVAVLAHRYEIPYMTSGVEATRAPGDSTALVTLMMPRELRRAINIEAAELETSASRLVIDILVAKRDKR